MVMVSVRLKLKDYLNLKAILRHYYYLNSMRKG